MTVGRRGSNKKSLLGIIDPGLRAQPGERMRMCTGNPGTQAHGHAARGRREELLPVPARRRTVAAPAPCSRSCSAACRSRRPSSTRPARAASALPLSNGNAGIARARPQQEPGGALLEHVREPARTARDREQARARRRLRAECRDERGEADVDRRIASRAGDRVGRARAACGTRCVSASRARARAAGSRADRHLDRACDRSPAASRLSTQRAHDASRPVGIANLVGEPRDRLGGGAVLRTRHASRARRRCTRTDRHRSTRRRARRSSTR